MMRKSSSILFDVWFVKFITSREMQRGLLVCVQFRFGLIYLFVHSSMFV